MFANSRRLVIAVVVLGACALAGASCSNSGSAGNGNGGARTGAAPTDRGGAPASSGGAPAGNGGATTDSGSVTISPLVISTATRTPRTTSLSVNYWQWVATYGDEITGTDWLIAALKPAFMRVGGWNNDANTPDPFDNAAFDTAVAYARAVGAEPVIQVPHLADTAGNTPTPDTAAAMVTYANVTKGYGIKYFSIGNEPDLYATQSLPTNMSQPAIPGYTPTDYCTSASAYVAAMKAVDPTIKIVGPDLSWKYQAGTANDWLTPVLTQCGSLFDVISIHRYPFESAAATLSAAAADPAAFRSVINSVLGILQATGQSTKPLALMEMNIVYDSTSCVIEASPGTVGAALWLADSVGTAIELGLWTTAVWDISDTDDYAFGLIGMPPTHTPRPAYYAYSLYADHFGPTLLNAPLAPAGVSAHASRNQADNATEVIVINWNKSPAGLSFQVTGLPTAPANTTFVLPAVSIAAVEIPDNGAATAWTYGEAQRETSSGPQVLAAGTTSTAAVDAGNAAGGAGRAVGTGCVTATPCDKDAAAPILPAPVLDPTGTYGGKTYAEWGAAWTKWLLELPGPDFPVIDSTGALCAMGQSSGDDGGAGANDIFFLANALGGGNVTRSCTIPAGQMIFFPIIWIWADNGDVPAGSQETDQQLQGAISAYLTAVNAIDFEIDGKSYGSTVCDFASYLTVWTQFSYTVPDTPTNICNTLPVGCPNWSGSVPKSFVGGYYIMLAPLSAGSHTLHFTANRNAVPSLGMPSSAEDVTYNLTVE